MDRRIVTRLTHKLTVESVAEQLAKIDYATKVWLLLEDELPQWWAVVAEEEHPYDFTDSGLVYAVYLYVGSADFKINEISEENAARLVDDLTGVLSRFSQYENDDNLPELLRD